MKRTYHIIIDRTHKGPLDRAEAERDLCERRFLETRELLEEYQEQNREIDPAISSRHRSEIRSASDMLLVRRTLVRMPQGKSSFI